MSRLVIFRLVFVASLAIAAVVCGYVAYAVISNLEDDVAIQTYESVANSALTGAQAITARKVQGGRVMASIMSFAFPDASMWPFVYLDGYAETSSEIAQLAASTSLALIMLVDPDDAERFEAFALDTYNENGFSEAAGRSEFGFGIYQKNHNIIGQNIPCQYSDGKCPDTSGENPWGGVNKILAPIFLHNIKNAKSLMFNVYSEQFRTTVLDSMIECVEKAEAYQIKPLCGVVTAWVQIIVKPGPASVLYQPIFPINDPNTMVSFTGTSIHWEEVLLSIVPDYIDGLICVISDDTGKGTYTFVIHGGDPELLGQGDLHDPAFNKFGHSIVLNKLETLASASVTYTLTVYPTELLFQEFETNSPIAISLSFVGVILICSAIFFLYDFFVRNEANQRKMILEMKRRFVRYISHEIRTPLNIVCMGLDLLQGELRTDIEKQKNQSIGESYGDSSIYEKTVKVITENESYWLDLTGDVLENTNNAVSILNDLLNFDKIESGTFKLEFAKVAIWKLVSKTIEEFQIQAKSRKVKLDFSIETCTDEGDVEKAPNLQDSMKQLSSLSVLGDDVRLAQVLRNLTSNALKFTPEDGEVMVYATYNPHGLPGATPSLSTDVPSDDEGNESRSFTDQTVRAGSVVITVKDSGVGLTHDQLGQLFTEGLQFDKNKLQAGGGSGLGLCITKEIVQQHGGTIEASSEGRGMGTSMMIELPLYEGLEDSHQKEQELEQLGTGTETVFSSSSEQKHHILVVDDVLCNSKMLCRLLEREGHTCTLAGNGQEAVDEFLANREKLGALPFSTILMDFEMPVMKGPEATERLRELGCSSLIIGITGNVLAEDVALFKAAGCNNVLPKPVRLAAIKAIWKSFSDP